MSKINNNLSNNERKLRRHRRPLIEQGEQKTMKKAHSVGRRLLSTGALESMSTVKQRENLKRLGGIF